MKKLFLLLAISLSMSISSQIGIGTANADPSAMLDINSANKGLLIPRTSLTGKQDVSTIPSPANGLMVYNLATAGTSPDNVIANNMYKFNGASNQWELLLSQEALDDLAIPLPAVFILTSDINNFLNGIGAGEEQLTPMTEIKNNIPGLSYNISTSTVTFGKGGTYKIDYIYEGDHQAACTLSSYFVDFPYQTSSTTRIHSTSSHNEGLFSNHGGTISYTGVIPANRTWDIKLGRGQSGNCSGPGNSLHAGSTHVFIYKIGS
ncbi:hypothetical protein J3D55_001567 [Chryseobacterium ginsenosidimutans]|uniref:hypothetical protein n=1 Tax=Chryseobacterium ginsenosidimutans TaxID=687846 RepID=UPI002166C9C2|nr:hypothetical protein [Chryseobacterium ginsenosidimutans]MCS3868651.1 hypothetical protein [Chryseobacterium ginsenosidimutans]